jgi:hypothetical protein
MSNNPTQFFYCGAEDARLLDVLIAAGVKRVSLNYKMIHSYSDTKIEHIFLKLRANAIASLIDPAIGTYVKELVENWPGDLPREPMKEIADFAEGYIAFVKKWEEHLDYALNLDFDPIFKRPVGFRYETTKVELADGKHGEPGHEFVQTWDEALLATCVHIIKVHHAHHDLEEMPDLRRFAMVALRNIENKSTVTMLMQTARRNNLKIYAIGMSKTEWLDRMGFEGASISAWLAGKMYGQTYVFDGRNLLAYNKHQQRECRLRYQGHWRNLGFNPDKILANDVVEVCKACLRAWVDFEKFLHKQATGGIVGVSQPNVKPPVEFSDDPWTDELPLDVDEDTYATKESSDTEEELATTQIVQQPKSEATKRAELLLEDTPIPGFDFGPYERLANTPLDKPVVIPTHQQQMLKGNQNAAKGRPTNKKNMFIDGFPMQCNNCFAQEKCPKFVANSLCAFREEFNELSTRNVEEALTELENLAQIQATRLNRGLMWEMLMNGGNNDKQTGEEIDRQRKILEIIAKTRREISTVNVQLTPNGIFAQLFGEGVVSPKIISAEDAIDVDAE